MGMMAVIDSSGHTDSPLAKLPELPLAHPEVSRHLTEAVGPSILNHRYYWNFLLIFLFWRVCCNSQLAAEVYTLQVRGWK